MPFANKPLSGVKVIELGTLIAGPFASRICGEFGADVIKIESPDGGDPCANGASCTKARRCGGSCRRAIKSR